MLLIFQFSPDSVFGHIATRFTNSDVYTLQNMHDLVTSLGYECIILTASNMLDISSVVSRLYPPIDQLTTNHYFFITNTR